MPSTRQSRHARARAEGYKNYDQKNSWQTRRRRGLCIGCRISMPPDYSPKRGGSKLCSICNATADPPGGGRSFPWQARYQRLIELHRRKRGRRTGWGDSEPTRIEQIAVAYGSLGPPLKASNVA